LIPAVRGAAVTAFFSYSLKAIVVDFSLFEIGRSFFQDWPVPVFRALCDVKQLFVNLDNLF